MLWEQEAPGSNPGIPTQRLTRSGASSGGYPDCWMSISPVSRGFGRSTWRTPSPVADCPDIQAIRIGGGLLLRRLAAVSARPPQRRLGGGVGVPDVQRGEFVLQAPGVTGKQPGQARACRRSLGYPAEVGAHVRDAHARRPQAARASMVSTASEA